MTRKTVEKQSTFQAVYQSINQFQVGVDTHNDLKKILAEKFDSIPLTDMCYHIKDDIIKLIT